MRRRYGCPLLIGLLFLACGWAADPLPPKPARYVNDAAGVLNPQTAAQLNQRLEEFERKTSNQVLVATFPRVPEGYAMEDFTQRTAESWGVGQKQTDNGAVLFVFPQDRKMRIEVGYGLEGVLPDALAKRIIENEIVPAFRAGDFNAGIARGADAIMRAATGEYKGTGRTVAEREAEGSPLGGILGGLFVLLIIFIVLQSLGQMGRGTSYGRRGRNDVFPPPFGGGSWGGGGGSRRSGGGFGGGGGFSGGGGSFGGGGASGSW